MRNTWNRIDHLIADWANQSWGSSWHFLDDGSTFRHICLTEIARRHLAATLFEHGPDVFADFRVSDERNAHDLSDGLSGDIVLGRPQTTTHDDGIASSERNANAFDHAALIVADLGLKMRIDSG